MNARRLMIAFLPLLLASGIAMSQTSRIGPDPFKPEGAIRIGLITPQVSLIGGGGTVTQETSTLRQSLTSYLMGPRIGTIDLKARLESLALEEAKERRCDYLLSVALTRRRKSAAGGTYSSGTKTGDEFTFEYKLLATAAEATAPVTADILRASVTSDGEDVLTHMVETAAQKIVSLARPARSQQTVAGDQTQNAEIVSPQPRPSPMASPTSSPS